MCKDTNITLQSLASVLDMEAMFDNVDNTIPASASAMLKCPIHV